MADVANQAVAFDKSMLRACRRVVDVAPWLGLNIGDLGTGITRGAAGSRAAHMAEERG